MYLTPTQQNSIKNQRFIRPKNSLKIFTNKVFCQFAKLFFYYNELLLKSLHVYVDKQISLVWFIPRFTEKKIYCRAACKTKLVDLKKEKKNQDAR